METIDLIFQLADYTRIHLPDEIMDQSRYVTDQTEDRQWDARFNFHDQDYLDKILQRIQTLDQAGKFVYVLVSGVEVGDNVHHNDYMVTHVHCAFIFKNRISKKSILNHLDIIKSYGFYLVPRNRQLPYSGWRAHHTKVNTKKDPTSLVLYENGAMPHEKTQTLTKVSDLEKKRKLDEVLLDMHTLIQENKESEAWEKYPRTFLQYGEKIKSMISQKRTKTGKSDPHIWVYGNPGLGKTQVMAFVYPNYYKKNLDNKFFDLYDAKVHSHIILEDLDHHAVERLGLNFIKTICDEAGFPIDQKYKTPQLITTTCLVTSNFTIPEIVNGMENTTGSGVQIGSLLRRFFHVQITDLLRLLGLKLLPPWDLAKLKRDGNSDPSKLFVSWDYISNRPTCKPLENPTHYQEIIRNYFYQ